MLSTPTSLSPNTLFHGRYRIVRRISAGGMGAVYEVLDETTKSARALKVMLPTLVEDPKLRQRFALEAHVTGAVESDHLVRVLDAGVDEESGVPFLLMDLLRGQDIGSMIKERGAISPSDTVLFLRQAAFALDKTHAANIVHRDLKPENLFITYRDDGSPCVKVLDFGIAKVLTLENTSKTTEALGTPLYMAPEQVRGQAGSGPWIDIYAIGHIAYTMLVGEAYFKEEKEQGLSVFEMFTCIVEGAREAPCARARRRRNISLPAAFDSWFAKATALSAASRFPNASAEIAALADVFSGALLPTAPAAPRAPSALPVSNAMVSSPNAMGTPYSTPGSTPPSYSSQIPSYSPSQGAMARTQAPAHPPSGALPWKAIAAVSLGAVGLFTGLGLGVRWLYGGEQNSVSGEVPGIHSNKLIENTVSAAAAEGDRTPVQGAVKAAPEGELKKGPDDPLPIREMSPEQRKAKRTELEAKWKEGSATLKDIRALRAICVAAKDKKCAQKTGEFIKQQAFSYDDDEDELAAPMDEADSAEHAKPALRKPRKATEDALGF